MCGKRIKNETSTEVAAKPQAKKKEQKYAMEVSSHHAGVVVVPLEGQCRVIVTLNIVSLMLAVFLE